MLGPNAPSDDPTAPAFIAQALGPKPIAEHPRKHEPERLLRNLVALASHPHLRAALAAGNRGGQRAPTPRALPARGKLARRVPTRENREWLNFWKPSAPIEAR